MTPMEGLIIGIFSLLAIERATAFYLAWKYGIINGEKVTE